MNEEWRPVVGYEGLYEVSSLGRVKRVALHPIRGTAGKVLTPKEDAYLRVTLFRNDGKRYCYGIHALVAAAFVGPRPTGHLVDHIDENKRNNHADNVQYLLPIHNTRKSIARDLSIVGVRSNGGKLSYEDACEIRRLSAHGISRAELGRRYGVAAPYVTQIVQGKKWKEAYA